jgi:hypothetical protein
MPEQWPLSLQQLLEEASFNYSKGDTVIRSEMEVGPAKVRRRFTKSIDRINGQITINQRDLNQFNTLENFFDTTLNGGTKPFYFDHPITGVPSIFRFVGPFNVVSQGGGIFTAQFVWEKLP